MPQTGELWLYHVRPAEWKCPLCDAPLHIDPGIDDVLVRIEDHPSTWLGTPAEMQCVRGCRGWIRVPGGWVAFRVNRDPTIYLAPYTFFEPADAWCQIHGLIPIGGEE